MRPDTAAFGGWPVASEATAACSTAFTVAVPQTAAASTVTTLDALECISAAATTGAAAEVAPQAAAACSTGCALAAAANGPNGADEGGRLTGGGRTMFRDVEGASVNFTGNGASSSLERHLGTDTGQKGSSTAHSLPLISSAARGCEVLPAPSLFTLPRCSAVRALLAGRMKQADQQQQQSPQQQQQQVQQRSRDVQAIRERERRPQQVEQQGEGRQRTRPQREEERRSSSSDGSSRGRSVTGGTHRNTHLRLRDACADTIGPEPEHAPTLHGKRQEWDREDEDDPILTDFSSLEEEAFPYPLPCCSFFELLPSDEEPLVPCPKRLPQEFQQRTEHPRELQGQLEVGQQGRQEQHLDLQQQRVEEAGRLGESRVLLQVQDREEQHRSEMSRAQLRGEGQWAEQQHRMQEGHLQQPATKNGKADGVLPRKRRIYFTPAYTTETDVYTQLLERHFGKQKTSTVEARGGEEDRLPAALGREYLNFQPPPAFEATELRPKTFRDRVAAIKRDIESLCIPPPPSPCPLRFPKFISHAQRLTAALAAARPQPIVGKSVRVSDAAAATTPVDSTASDSAAAATTAGTCSFTTAACNTDSPAVAVQRTAGSSSVSVSAVPGAGCSPPSAGTTELRGDCLFAAAVAAETSHAVTCTDVGVADRTEVAAVTAVNSRAPAEVAGAAQVRASSAASVAADDERSSRRATTAGESVASAGGDRASSEDEQGKPGENTSAGSYHSPSDKQYYSEATATTVTSTGEGASFSAAALRAVADYFGFFAVSRLRTPSMEEAVACCVAEELRGWPRFLDPTTMKILKDVLAHSKARRFNRFPCRLAWPPIPSLCTYSESNLRFSMRELVNLKTYSLVQDYYRTRFHRQTSIHNFAVDQHGIEQRKLAAAEARCLQERKSGIQDDTQWQQQLPTAAEASQTRQNETVSHRKQDRLIQGNEGRHPHSPAFHAPKSSHLSHTGRKHLPSHPATQCQQQQEHNQHQEQEKGACEEGAAGEGMEFSDVNFSLLAPYFFFDRYTATRTPPTNELDFFRRVPRDEAIISVAFYHATRGTKLAAFDVLSTQTLLDVRTAFLGCCEAESEPGIPVFPGSCFLIDGVLYPDTSHASSAPEYAETIAEHLTGSGKLAKKMRIPSLVASPAASGNFTGSAGPGGKVAGGEVRIIRPRRRLDGSIRVARPALRQRSCFLAALQEKEQDSQSCTYLASSITAKVSSSTRESGSSREASQEATRDRGAGLIEENKTAIARSTGGAWDEQTLSGCSSTYAAVDDACGEELEEDEEGNDWISIPQHKAILNNMQLPLRSLECFVHQGTCEHRVIFWNVRQFDPTRDCCYVAAYPVRTYKPSSKAVTCQACDEHLACKGVLNSILCSVHNPTYLCESCYTVLFGGAAARKVKNPNHTVDRRSSTGAPPVTPFHQGEGTSGERVVDRNSAAEGGAAEEEEDDDPDPFALHFALYDG